MFSLIVRKNLKKKLGAFKKRKKTQTHNGGGCCIYKIKYIYTERDLATKKKLKYRVIFQKRYIEYVLGIWDIYKIMLPEVAYLKH